jgi:CRISPR system Cascade subunit CasA
MSQFNLIDKKWIPVRFLNGDRKELGIKDTLLHAKEIAAIEDSSPLVVASLHRFLLAVLYRALEGPTDIDQAKELFKTGLPSKKIADYLDKWRDRFYLFDEKYPFGQVPSVPDSEIEPWTKLTAEYNATTNKVLFDHTDTAKIDPISPKAAARWVISTLNFSVRGGRGYRPSPSSDGVICIPIGEDLQQTFLLTLVPYPNRMVMEADLPIWEREPNLYSYYKSGLERTASGFADLYTWQARAMRLLPLDDEKTTQVAFIPGIGYVESELRDPMVPYQERKTGIKQIGWEDRGFWRSFDSLLPDANSSSGLEPRVVSYLATLSRSRLIGSSIPFLVIGQKFKNAAIEFWRMERFKLPLDIVSNRSFKSAIQGLLELAEVGGDVLENALREMGKALITKGDRELMPDKWVSGKLKPGDATKYIMSIEASPRYWSTLESKFHDILQAYTLEKNPDEIELDWLQAVRDALKDSWEQHRASVSTGDVWAIRAVVKAEWNVSKKIKELNATIADFKKSLNKEDV